MILFFAVVIYASIHDGMHAILCFTVWIYAGQLPL